MTRLQTPGLLRPGEIARLFGIDESTVRLADEQGRFTADQRTPGGHRRYDPHRALRFYDELRRWAGKPRASTSAALESTIAGQITRQLVLDDYGTGRLARLRAACAVEGCPWHVELPRSLGTGAEARHFALHLYAGHYLDDHHTTI